jgi:hypothetical protein
VGAQTRVVGGGCVKKSGGCRKWVVQGLKTCRWGCKCVAGGVMGIWRPETRCWCSKMRC